MKTLPPGYKRGSHGFIFRWNGFEYVRSHLDPDYSYRASSIDGTFVGGRKREPIIDGKKLCKGKHGCGQMKPISEFGKHRGYYVSYCKPCDRKRNTAVKRSLRGIAA